MWTEIISEREVIIRITLAMILALVLGIEREFKQQPAGIRTHILISVGSCLLMLLSIIVPHIYHSTNNDPARIAAQIVSGIGFLGAGAIMRNGLTTCGPPGQAEGAAERLMHQQWGSGGSSHKAALGRTFLYKKTLF